MIIVPELFRLPRRGRCKPGSPDIGWSCSLIEASDESRDMDSSGYEGRLSSRTLGYVVKVT
jgi:hypothetical protein